MIYIIYYSMKRSTSKNSANTVWVKQKHLLTYQVKSLTWLDLTLTNQVIIYLYRWLSTCTQKESTTHCYQQLTNTLKANKYIIR